MSKLGRPITKDSLPSRILQVLAVGVEMHPAQLGEHELLLDYSLPEIAGACRRLEQRGDLEEARRERGARNSPTIVWRRKTHAAPRL